METIGYAITISPPCRLGTTYLKEAEHEYKYYEQATILHDDYGVIMRALRQPYIKDFIIYPELEPDTGRLHYHGTIESNDTIALYKKVIPRLRHLGYIKLKRIDNRDKWEEYCRKDWELTQAVLEINNPMKKEHLGQPIRQSHKTYISRRSTYMGPAPQGIFKWLPPYLPV